MSKFSRYVRFFLALLFSAALIYGDLTQPAFSQLRERISLVLVPLRAASELPAKTVFIIRNYFTSRQTLINEKAALLEKIQQENVRLKSMDFYIKQNEELRNLLNLRARLDGEWRTAELSRNFSQPLSKHIHLNKGVVNDILPGMTAVDDAGIIGQIIRVDADASIVNLITSSNQWMTARVQRNHVLLILRGDGDDGLIIEYAPNSTDVRIGDILLADGGVYPPGYPVATINAVTPDVVYMNATAVPLSRFWDNTAVLIYAGRPRDK